VDPRERNVKALVLCAGQGTRLGALTRDLPKPMLPIGGEPLLAHMLRHLCRQGYHEIAINLHQFPEAIPGYFGDGSGFGVRLHYVYEPVLLGTAGAVKNLEPFFAEVDDFLVLYGDLLLDEDLRAMREIHRARRADATLLLHQRQGSNSLVRLDEDGRITGFVERPSEQERRENPFPWVNSGVQILSRSLLHDIPVGRPADLPRDVYAPRVHSSLLVGVPLRGFRCAIDSPERYAAACAAFEAGRVFQEGASGA
jgi:NDP-sugar pyrophosphorylase family protein